MREIKFRAFWRDTLKPISDFNQEYLIDACNDEIFIVNEYTGLKDCNGKEIYEGDIVIPHSLENKMNKSVIVYEFNEFRIKGESLYWNWDLKQVEVVGNIYENPELL